MCMNCIAEIAKKQDEENIELRQVLKSLGRNENDLLNTIEQESVKIQNTLILSDKEVKSIQNGKSGMLDIIGKIINNLEIIGIIRIVAYPGCSCKKVYYKCKCIKCGSFCEVERRQLLFYKTKKEICPNCSRYFAQTSIRSLVGEKIGRLLILRRLKTNDATTDWLCLCDCGNYCIKRTGYLNSVKLASCGCYRKELDKLPKKTYWEPGYIVGNWKLIKKIEDKTNDKNDKWEIECICGCGETRIEKSNNIRWIICKKQQEENKKILEECRKTMKPNPIPENVENLIGKEYGFLKIIGFACRLNYDNYWICECSCRTKKIIKEENLKRGVTRSCGCMRSYGEIEIILFLNKYNIKYDTQVMFEDCVYEKQLRFDFRVYYPNSDKWFLLEFQGIQHYKPVKFKKNWTEEKMQEEFEKVKEKDKIKRKYCKENNIEIFYLYYRDCDSKVNKIPQKLGAKLGIDISDSTDDTNE